MNTAIGLIETKGLVGLVEALFLPLDALLRPSWCPLAPKSKIGVSPRRDATFYSTVVSRLGETPLLCYQRSPKVPCWELLAPSSTLKMVSRLGAVHFFAKQVSIFLAFLHVRAHARHP